MTQNKNQKKIARRIQELAGEGTSYAACLAAWRTGESSSLPIARALAEVRREQAEKRAERLKEKEGSVREGDEG